MEKFSDSKQPSSPETVSTREQTVILGLISTPRKTEQMVEFALEEGASSALLINARGTAPGPILAFLGLNNIKRSLAVLSVAEGRSSLLLEKIKQKIDLQKEMNGIAWIQRPYEPAKQPAIPLASTATQEQISSDSHSSRKSENGSWTCSGTGRRSTDSRSCRTSENNIHTPTVCEHSMIIVVVNDGEGKDVVAEARNRLNVGASIIKATGSAKHSEKVFDFELQPAKEIVLIISRTDQCTAVYETIYEALRTEDPGRGLIFSTPLHQVSGLLEQEQLKVSGLTKVTGLSEQKQLKASGLSEQEQLTGETVKRESTTEAQLDPGNHSSQQVTNYRKAVSESVNETEIDVGLVALVNRGHTAEIIQAAESVGGQGATLLYGREITVAARSIFDKLSQTEREAVLILASAKTAARIARALQAMHTEASLGVLRLFALPVSNFRLFSYGDSEQED